MIWLIIIVSNLAVCTDWWLNLPEYFGNYPPVPTLDAWSSSNVYYQDGSLTYQVDENANRIPDLSYAGYHYGQRLLPQVDVVMTIGPTDGDQTAKIQAALDALAARPADQYGRRGALLLLPGVYQVWGTIQIRQGGVVLRGSGNLPDPATNTIIRARGNNPYQRSVIILGTNNSQPWTAGPEVAVADQLVPVNSMRISVVDISPFRIGQEVIIRHPSTKAWIDALDGGGVVSDDPWSPGEVDMYWIRRITSIEGSTIHLDAPIYNHLDLRLSKATVAPVIERALVCESGLEDLRIEIETAGPEDEDHAWNAVSVVGAEDCWVRSVAACCFGYAGVRTSGVIRITVLDCQATDPVAIRTGGRMYNFATDQFSQLVLFSRCHAAGARHSFISNGKSSVSGIVWHRCTMHGGDFEGHRLWSQALLLDNCQELSGSGQAKLINRGDYGTSHGWGAAHSVIWQFNREIVCQRPPTAQNYAVSSAGWLRSTPYYPGPLGSIEIRSGRLIPESLYEAQMCDRLSTTPVQIISRSTGKALAVGADGLQDDDGIVQRSIQALGPSGTWLIVGTGDGGMKVVSGYSGKCMLVKGASLDELAYIAQGPYRPERPSHDEWQFESIDTIWYVIRSRHSGKVLTILDGKDADMTPVVQADYAGLPSQQFAIRLITAAALR